MGFESRQRAKRYVPQEGDTLQRIAERETEAGNPVSWQELARYNWGTTEADVVNEHLRDELGAYARNSANEFIITADVEPRGPLLIPQPFEANGLALKKTYRIRVRRQEAPPQFMACCSLPGVTFSFDTSFIRPSVVDHLKELEEVLQEHLEARLMVFGHTDRVGSEAYNKALSERRARSVYAFITNDAEAWEALYQAEEWGTRVVQTILLDLGYDVGLPDGIYGSATTDAVRQFQADQGLVTDGVAGPNTRTALFRVYMTGKHDIDLTPDRFMEPRHMGCGEFNPVEPTDLADEANRRVTLYLFHPDRLPNLPCQQGSLTPCHRQSAQPEPRFTPGFRCSFYDSIARRCGCEQPPLATVEILFDAPTGPEDRHRVGDCYQLISHDGACDHVLHCEKATSFDERRTVLRFEGIMPGLTYSLYQYMTPQVRIPLFQHVPFAALEAHGAETPELSIVTELEEGDPEAPEPTVSLASSEHILADHADDAPEDDAWYPGDPHLSA